jgi:hypothetical protein
LQDGAQAEVTATSPAPAKPDPAALKKQLMALIPKDQAGVFGFALKWHQLDKAPAEVTDRISGGWLWDLKSWPSGEL